MKRLIRAAAVAMTLGIASAAAAQPTADDIRKAAEQFDLGRKAFKNQEYVEAAEHFEQADLFAPSAGALKLALQARLKAEQTQRAAILAYLAQQRHSDNDELMAIAKPVLADAKKEFHLLTVKCDEPCELIIGTKLVHGQPDSERGIFLEAGTHKVRANWSEERTQSKEVKASKGAASTLTFEAPPIPEKPEPVVAPPPGGGGTDTGGGNGGQPRDGGVKDEGGGLPPGVFFTMAGVTAVLGGVTAWSGIDTQNNPGKDKVREQCAGQGDTCELYQEGVDKQNRTNILAGATAVVGVATIIVGIVTDWGGDDSASNSDNSRATAKRRPKPSIEPWLSVGNGAALGAMGRF